MPRPRYHFQNDPFDSTPQLSFLLENLYANSINNKGARMAECKHDSKKYYFDTTRRVNQFGVYPNQSTA